MVTWDRLQYLNPTKIKKLQHHLLQNLIRNQLPFHPFYSGLFRKNKIDTHSIKTTDDLKKIPFTSKEDIAPSKINPKKFLDFVLQPSENSIRKYATFGKKIKVIINKKSLYFEYKPVHLHFTTGRSANSTPFLYTQYDLEKLEEAGKRMMNILNVSNDDVIVNCFPYAPHLAFWQTFFVAKGANILALHTGGGKILGTEKIIKSAEGMKATVIAGMPGYLYHLLRTSREQKDDLSNLKLAIFGGERVPFGLKEKMIEMLKSMGAKKPRILSTYAFTEGKAAWAQCSEKSSYHLYPDYEFIEVVDKNGNRVNEGEKGEIVYTSLDWRGSVVLRYRTGDITKGLYYDKCSHCKRTLPRIDPEIERSSEFKEFMLTKIKGSLVNLNALFPIMASINGIDEWQVEIRKKNNDIYGVDELVIYVATSKNADFKSLKAKLESRISAETEISPQIVKMDLKELLKMLAVETELKERRIVDSRKKA